MVDFFRFPTAADVRRLLQSLYRLLSKRPIRFTRFGTFYVLFALGIGAAAINTGNNLLYLMLGILLGFIIVSGLLSDSCLWGLSTTWIPAESGYAGRALPLHAVIRKGWFPGVGISFEAEWNGAAPSTALVPWVSVKGSQAVRFVVTPQRRGWLTLERLRYATRFPFGLFEKTYTTLPKTQWLIYPAVQRLPLQTALAAETGLPHQPTQRPGPGSVPFILRDYRAGDSAQRIHWKLSAKRQQWVVSELEDESDHGNLIAVSSWPAGLSVSAQESLISFIASLAYSLHENQRPVGLATPDFFVRPDSSRQTLHRIFSYLALVEIAGAGTTRSPGIDSRAIDAITAWRAWEGNHAA